MITTYCILPLSMGSCTRRHKTKWNLFKTIFHLFLKEAFARAKFKLLACSVRGRISRNENCGRMHWYIMSRPYYVHILLELTVKFTCSLLFFLGTLRRFHRWSLILIFNKRFGVIIWNYLGVTFKLFAIYFDPRSLRTIESNIQFRPLTKPTTTSSLWFPKLTFLKAVGIIRRWLKRNVTMATRHLDNIKIIRFKLTVLVGLVFQVAWRV